MSVASSRGDAQPSRRPIELRLPFEGRWKVRNSPLDNVPSHGTDLFGSRYAIDFVGVDERGRAAVSRSWRTLLASEAPDIFVSFGRPVLAPLSGEVVIAHDAEEDHAARRSQLALVPYMLSQAGRVRRGVGAIAGNHVVISARELNALVAVVHLRSGSIRVRPGDNVQSGQQLGACGNSGNSTQPHVHVQAMDSADLSSARGVPILFSSFDEWPGRGRGERQARTRAIPASGSVVAPSVVGPTGER